MRSIKMATLLCALLAGCGGSGGRYNEYDYDTDADPADEDAADAASSPGKRSAPGDLSSFIPGALRLPGLRYSILPMARSG